MMVLVDNILIGGAMAYPFLKAKGNNVGNSLCSEEDITLARQLLSQDKGGKIILPRDHVVSESLEGEGELCDNLAIPDGKMGLDIGPETIRIYSEFLTTAKTIFWNGPMGLFESKNFSKGTMKICETIANNSEAFSVVGGGDSVAAVQQSGLADKFTHVSTGGGASLEFIEKGDLPGVLALKVGV